MRELRFGVKKEFLEAHRTKKLMVMGIIALFFALLDPVMLKMTPYLLKEFSGIDMGDMIQLTQTAELKDFHQDIYQLFTIVLVIVIGNVWLNEVKQRTLVIPVSKGLKLSTIILAKIITYAVLVNVLIYIAYTLNYFYSGIIFGFGVDYYQVFSSAVMMGLFYTFCIVFIISISIWVSKFSAVVFITLLVIFGGSFIASLLKVEVYTPYGLLNEASVFPKILSQTVISNTISVVILSMIIYYFGTIIANKKEIIKYK